MSDNTIRLKIKVDDENSFKIVETSADELREAIEQVKNEADNERRKERAAWERTRLQCTTMLQPYSRNRLRPQDVLCFEWDGSTGQATSGEEQLSAKEIWKRFEEAKKEMGC